MRTGEEVCSLVNSSFLGFCLSFAVPSQRIVQFLKDFYAAKAVSLSTSAQWAARKAVRIRRPDGVST